MGCHSYDHDRSCIFAVVLCPYEIYTTLQRAPLPPADFVRSDVCSHAHARDWRDMHRRSCVSSQACARGAAACARGVARAGGAASRGAAPLAQRHCADAASLTWFARRSVVLGCWRRPTACAVPRFSSSSTIPRAPVRSETALKRAAPPPVRRQMAPRWGQIKCAQQLTRYPPRHPRLPRSRRIQQAWRARWQARSLPRTPALRLLAVGAVTTFALFG